ncbi:hypothetical protein [Pseudonocardia broussonetiae]|uniref:MarR family transcriptional regulator n=1 Tax=Pseudonocardia broussonetiae TaxID=2736640 RepID=A0A6M6JSU0_9PSEU|nr:hypothetical protein [Pseudonocardia broussonetiae]QJY51164.1 hypothetical protein HOP40_34860 [Pseudonocardia broussonetiae]
MYRPLGEHVWAATANLTERDRRAVVAAMDIMTRAFDDVRTRLAAEASAQPGR